MPPKNQKDINKRERTTIDEARQEGIGDAEDGVELNVPSFTDPGGTSDLGVEEPVVPEPLRGESSSERKDSQER